MNKSIEKITETGCCPYFRPESMDNKELVFENKLFLKDHIKSLFHIPLNYGRVMEKDLALIEKTGAMPKEQLILSDEKSMWGSDVYIAVEKKIPDAEMATLSGTFLVRVFEGSYRNMDSFINSMKSYVKSKEKKIEKMYFFYPYCPKCAKAYGKNYVVILAKV